MIVFRIIILMYQIAFSLIIPVLIFILKNKVLYMNLYTWLYFPVTLQPITTCNQLSETFLFYICWMGVQI